MTAGVLIDLLEEQGLLDDKVIAALRSQVEGKQVTPQLVARLLVDKGHLTSYQAKKLIADLERAAASRAAGQGGAKVVGGLEVLDDDDVVDAGDALAPVDDELTLAEEPALAPRPSPASSPVSSGLEVLDDEEDVLSGTAGLTPLDEDAGLTPIDDPRAVAESGLTPLHDDDGLEPIDDLGLTPVRGPAPKGNAGKGAARPAAAAPSVGLEPIDTGLEPIDTGLTPVGGGGRAPSGGLEPVGGDLFGEAASADPFGGGVATAERKVAGKAEKQPKEKKHWVHRPIIILGIGSIIVLLLIGAGIIFMMRGQSSEEMFKAAEDAYDSGSYAAAITHYERFLKAYPDDAKASLARVKIGLATLRQSIGGSNWKLGLEAANQTLPKIETEEAFADARPELATLLPDIAEGFAKQGRDSSAIPKKQEMLDFARKAMDLVNNGAYIPTSIKQESAIEVRIDRINEDMLEIERDINREHELVKAIAAIDDALSKGQTPQAYDARKALLRTYPGLEGEPRVQEKVQAIVERERGLVRLEESVPIKPDNQEPPQPWTRRIVLASFRGKEAPGVGAQVLPIQLRGSVYGLEGATGKVRWRRFVGYDAAIHPIAVGSDVDADVLLADSQEHSLMRVKSGDGTIVWRLPVGEPFARPAIMDDRLLIATVGGKLLDVSLAKGEPQRAAVIPQPLRATPSAESGGPVIYQTGDHSNLYVLRADTLECQEVYYLGHREGSIRVPPVSSRGQIFVCENAGADFVLLRLLTTDKESGKLKRSQDVIRLPGNVLVPPLVYERRVFLFTDQGGIYVYEIEPTQSPPVKLMSQQLGSGVSRGLSWPYADSSQLWVADTQLSKYEIQTARRELVRKWRKDVGGQYVAPLQVVGNVLYHARQHAGSPGITVTAANAADGSVLWQSDLATPTVALTPAPGNTGIEALSAQGNVYPIDKEVATAQFSDNPVEPLSSGDRASAYTAAIPLDQGRLALVSQTHPENIILYEPGKGPPQVVKQRTDTGAITALPAPLKIGDLPVGLLLCSSGGRVSLVDPRSGDNLLLPLQPPIMAGEKVEWLGPALLTERGEAVIANNQQKVFRVGRKDEPQPHLAVLATRGVDAPLWGRLAAAKDAVYGIERGGREDVLVTFQLPNLDFKKQALKGRVVWGPEQVGDAALLVTTGDGLMCWDGGEMPRWTFAELREPLTGAPSLHEGHLLLATRQGRVWKVSMDAGQVAGKADLKSPLESSPLPFGVNFMLGGSDGVVYFLPAKSLAP